MGVGCKTNEVCEEALLDCRIPKQFALTSCGSAFKLNIYLLYFSPTSIRFLSTSYQRQHKDNHTRRQSHTQSTI
jgi:hypothetical protein